MKIARSTLIKAGAALLILGGGIAAMELLAATKAQTNKREAAPQVRQVEIIKPVFRDSAYRIDGSGLVESADSIKIQATVSGNVSYSFNRLAEGLQVKKGDLLLTLDSREAENNLNLARSGLMKAVASLVPQFKTSGNGLYEKWDRYLGSLDFSTGKTPDLPKASNSREKLLISTYGIYNAYYTVKNAEILLEQYSLYAPADGYISGGEIAEKSFISAGQTLLTLVDAKDLKISVPLSVDELKRIDFAATPRAEILSTDSEGKILEGVVTGRSMKIDQSSQTADIYIRFANPGLDPDFAPGSFVDVRIAGMTLKDTAAVPRYAIQDNSYVYICQEGKLGKADVVVRAVTGDVAYIDDTLPVGTEIVTTILQNPLLGMKLGVIDEKDS